MIFLIFSAFFLFLNNYNNLLYTSFGLLAYASVVVTIGSGHAGEFIRYRVWVEYIMWFIALLPIGMTFWKNFHHPRKESIEL